MSYTYLLEQGEEYSAASFSDIPPSVLLNLNLTADESYSKDNETESCQSSRSGTMSAPSTELLGAEKSMLFAEDSLAKTSQLLGKVMELTEEEADSGQKWPESLAKYDPNMSAHPIEGSESGLWPTPQRVDYKGTSRESVFQQRAAQYEVWSMGGRDYSTIYPNPMAYEAIMGWPIQWTELKPLEMDRFQQWLQAHSAFLACEDEMT